MSKVVFENIPRRTPPNRTVRPPTAATEGTFSSDASTYSEFDGGLNTHPALIPPDSLASDDLYWHAIFFKGGNISDVVTGLEGYTILYNQTQGSPYYKRYIFAYKIADGTEVTGNITTTDGPRLSVISGRVPLPAGATPVVEFAGPAVSGVDADPLNARPITPTVAGLYVVLVLGYYNGSQPTGGVAGAAPPGYEGIAYAAENPPIGRRPHLYAAGRSVAIVTSEDPGPVAWDDNGTGNFDHFRTYTVAVKLDIGDPVVAAGDHTHVEADVTDLAHTTAHSVLTGLTTGDDHSQYLKEKASGGVAAEVPTHTHASAAEAGQFDHGVAAGLTDDDHTIYGLADGSRQFTKLDVSGLTGAVAASRYVGATTTGAPTVGTFAVGDYVVAQDGAIYVCTVAGTPGTWASVGAGADVDAIHDNVAGEIALVAEKVTPVSADLVLIEDSAASNAKKRVQVGNLPGGASALNDLSDVTITTPTTGQVVKYNGTGWVNDTDLTGSGSLPASPVKGDLAVFNGTDWVRVAVGSNDQVLTADSAQTAGVKWAAGAGGGWADTVTPAAAPAGTYDDEFDDATITGWTQLDRAGHAATWTEANDVLSVLNPGADLAAETHSMVKAIPLSVGDYIQTAVYGLSVNQNYPSVGLIMADGATYAAGQQVIARWDMADGNFGMEDWSGYNTRDAIKGSVAVEAHQIPLAWCHLRLTYVSANTFRLEVSPDGVSWFQPFVDQTVTLTPTHAGVFSLGWQAAMPFVGGFHYFRSNA